MLDYTSSFMTQSPVSGSIADVVTQNEQIQLQRQQQRQQQERFNYLKQDKEREKTNKFIENSQKDLDYIEVKDTNFNSFLANTVDSLRDRAGEIAMELKYRGDSTRRPELESALLNINGAAKKLKALSLNASDIIEQMNNGAIHDDPDLRNYFKNLGNQKDIEVDDRGNMFLIIPTKDGTERKISVEDAIRGIDGFKLTPKVNIFEEVDKVAQTAETSKNVSYNGYEKTTTESIRPEYAEAQAKLLIYGSTDESQWSNKNLSNGAKSWLFENGYDYRNPTPEMLSALDQLQNDIQERIINSNKQISENSYDFGAERQKEALEETKRNNAANRGFRERELAFRQEQARAKQKDAPNDNIIISEADSGAFDYYKNANNSYSLSYAATTVEPIDIHTLTFRNGDKRNVKVYGLAFDGNTPVIDYESSDDEGYSERRTSGAVSNNTAERVARALGYKSLKDAKQALSNNTLPDLDTLPNL